MVNETHFKYKMKKIIFSITILLLSGYTYAQKTLDIEITGVEKNGGTLYLSLFNSEQSYKKKEVYQSQKLNPAGASVKTSLSLPAGEYFFSVFQDTNKNGKLDSSLIGIPKEPVGLSNYDGKGVPGNFNRHKVVINETTFKVTIGLHKL